MNNLNKIMTPSQKAKELFNQIYNSPYVQEHEAKRCAIIAVNEVIIMLDKNRGYTQCLIDIKHWEAVRVELNAL